MSKQFVVRLRKGSPTGDIVANSQVITLAGPVTGNIFPSNFTDGRLQGKITTANRVANFLKTTLYPLPTTTTTSTSTTTQAPGTLPVFSPVLGPTQVALNVPTSTTITGGPTAAVNSGNVVQIQFRKRASINGFFGLTYLADTWISDTGELNKFSNANLTASGTYTGAAVSYTQPALVTYEARFPNSVNWTYGAGNIVTLNQQIGVLVETITITSDSTTFATDSNSSIKPGETVTVTLTNLKVGNSYSLRMQHFAQPTSRTQITKDEWFNINLLNGPKPSSYEGWIKGGSLGSSIFPFYQSLNATEHVWYYAFVASRGSKTINLPVQSNAQINRTWSQTDYINYSPDNAVPRYIFDLCDGNGLNPITVNYGTLIPQTLNSEPRKYFNLRSREIDYIVGVGKFVLPQGLQPYATQYSIEEGSSSITPEPPYILVAFTTPNRRFTPYDLGSSGRRYLINLSNVDTDDVIVDTEFNIPTGTVKSLAVSPTVNANYPTGLNYVLDAANSWTNTPGGSAAIKIKSDNRNDPKIVSVKVYTWLIQNEPGSNTFFANTNPDFLVASFSNVIKLDEVSASPPSITNWTSSPGTTINEITSPEFTGSFTITDTISRVVYWKISGSGGNTVDDYDGPINGTIQTVAGSVGRSVFVKAKADAVFETTETFTVVFYTSSADMWAGTNSFYVSPVISITDASSGINEQVKIADADQPPYYRDDSLVFLISGGVRNDIVDVYDGTTRYPSVTLDTNGSATSIIGPFSLLGTVNLDFTFRATGNVRRVTFTIVQTPVTVGGGAEGCPDPQTPISISPTESRLAGELAVGDLIYTVHEHRLEYGYYAITHAELVEEPKLRVTFDTGKSITVSLSHKFLQAGEIWTSARDLRQGSSVQTVEGSATVTSLAKMGVGYVVRLEVDQAHTYVANGFISHNKIISSTTPTFESRRETPTQFTQ